MISSCAELPYPIAAAFIRLSLFHYYILQDKTMFRMIRIFQGRLRRILI
jgi:hypothetical protein